MLNIATCNNLKSLNLSGCIHLTDVGIMNLCKGTGFPHLNTVKLAGLSQLGETCVLRFLAMAPKIHLLDVNSLINLSDQFISTMLKDFSQLETLLINQTPLISPQILIDAKQSKPKLKIVRHVIKNTDPKDDGLRIPYIPVSKVLKKPSKKKKKDKK